MLYFAYGSNMESDRIKAANRCPTAQFVCVAKLSDYKIAFTRRSKCGHGVADAVVAKRCVVWGVVWRLTCQEVETLDTREGAAAAVPKYVRHRVTVSRADNSKELTCDTYFVADDQREEQEVSSTKQYLGHLLNGAVEHRLPRHYVAKLLSLWQAAADGTPDAVTIHTRTEKTSLRAAARMVQTYGMTFDFTDEQLKRRKG